MPVLFYMLFPSLTTGNMHESLYEALYQKSTSNCCLCPTYSSCGMVTPVLALGPQYSPVVAQRPLYCGGGRPPGTWLQQTKPTTAVGWLHGHSGTWGHLLDILGVYMTLKRSKRYSGKFPDTLKSFQSLESLLTVWIVYRNF